jgi:hypothetical protein
LFICGGKGKTSLKTPDEIDGWGDRLSLPDTKVNDLVYHSRMAAKVDSSLVQDGFQLYHHAFFFTRGGSWTVVQQGMNTARGTARRYHWFSDTVADIVCEPHSGIVSPVRNACLDLTAKKSGRTRELSTEMVQGNYTGLMKDVQILRRYSTSVSRMAAMQANQEQLVLLELDDTEFHHHPVVNEDFSRSKYLEKILCKVCDHKPSNYEKLVAIEGVGPKTVRALSLVSEVIYGAKPSYEDPARYSFAHGGKDGTPYPVDRKTYGATIAFFREVVRKMKIFPSERESILRKLM